LLTNYISILSLLGLNLFILRLILSNVFKRYSSFSLFIKFLNSFNSSKFFNIIPLFLVGFPNSSEGFNSITILDGVSLILLLGIFKMNIPLTVVFILSPIYRRFKTLLETQYQSPSFIFLTSIFEVSILIFHHKTTVLLFPF
jgi:hypothetical protein